MFGVLCFIRPIVSIGCESQEPARQHGCSQRQMVCVVTESQQVIIDQETVCNWPVFGPVHCAEAGLSATDGGFYTPCYRMVCALKARLLLREQEAWWTFFGVVTREQAVFLSPCLNSFSTQPPPLILSPFSGGNLGVRLCLKRRANTAHECREPLILSLDSETCATGVNSAQMISLRVSYILSRTRSCVLHSPAQRFPTHFSSALTKTQGTPPTKRIKLP